MSVGVLSYFQKPDLVLKHLSQKVKKGSRIVFMDYDKFFFIMPNVEWLSDDKKLMKWFTSAGFDVKIERKRGILWQHVFIHGVKR